MNLINSTLIFLIAFVAVFLQSYSQFFRHWLGFQPNLLPCLMVYAGLTQGWSSMSLMAVLGGLWMDTLSMNPLGVSILPLFLVGIVLEHYRPLILREQAYAQFMLGGGASLLVPVLTLMIIRSRGEQPIAGWRFAWQLAGLTLSGALLTPLLFGAIQKLQKAFNYQPAPEPNFRPNREIKYGRV